MTSQPEKSRRDFATFTALLVLLAVAACLILLVTLVLPQVLGLVIVAVAFAGSFGLHYILWGHWLSRFSQSEKSAAEQGDRPR